MKTLSFKIYAAPVALLLMAGPLATPSASAEPAPGTRTVQAEFRYNRSAPADEIYAKLRQTAKRMCTVSPSRPISLRKIDDACVATVMEDGISRIGRVDLAEVHDRTAG